MARYEDTTQYERDVMTSLGYHWRGEGWQRGFDLSDGDMVVEAWVGDRLPERQKELSNITHLWDQKLAILINWIGPYISRHFYRFTHYWFAAADIPVANDIPVHCADAIRCNVRRPPQGSCRC